MDPATAPSFVVIVFDDRGFGDLSVQRNRLIRTPRLDALDAMMRSVEENPRGWR